MSSIWNLLSRALSESSDKDTLISYIRRTYGDNEADEIEPALDKMWNPEGLRKLNAHMTGYFSDSTISSILSKAMDREKLSTPSAPQTKTAVGRRSKGSDDIEDLAVSEPVVGNRGRGRPPGSTTKPGTKSTAPADSRYVDPDQLKHQQARAADVAAMRPDRAGTKANVPTAQPKGTGHQFGGVRGTSQGHTRPPQDQDSLVGVKGQTVGDRLAQLQAKLDAQPTHKYALRDQERIDALSKMDPDELLAGTEAIPSTLNQRVGPLRAKEDELTKKFNILSVDPKKNAVELDKVARELEKAKQGVAALTSTGQSGYSDLQKYVDGQTAEYGRERGEAEAKRLGVPTTRERTVLVRDKDTGKAKIDPETGKPETKVNIWDANRIMKFMNAEPELEPGTYDTVPALGGDKRSPGGRDSEEDHVWQAGGGKMPGRGEKQERSPIRKPMVRDPRTGEMVMRQGDFIGQTFKPSGVSRKVSTMRADQATGNFKYGSRMTDPSKESGPTQQPTKWNGEDWVLPSVYVTDIAKKKAAGFTISKDGKRWVRGELPGNIVPTSAASQKAAGPSPTAKDSSRDARNAVKKAYDK